MLHSRQTCGMLVLRSNERHHPIIGNRKIYISFSNVSHNDWCEMKCFARLIIKLILKYDITELCEKSLMQTVEL